MTNPPQQPGTWPDPSSWQPAESWKPAEQQAAEQQAAEQQTPPAEQQTQQQPYPGPYGPAPVPPGYAPPPPGVPAGYPGQPGYPGYGYGAPMPVAAPNNTLAIVSLVLALVGLGCGITAPVGAILGHVARRQIRERGEGGDGMALAGIIVGWIITGLMIVYIAVVIIIAIAAANSAPSTF